MSNLNLCQWEEAEHISKWAKQRFAVQQELCFSLLSNISSYTESRDDCTRIVFWTPRTFSLHQVLLAYFKLNIYVKKMVQHPR